MTRTNLVDAYDNRSVVAKLVNMEERISGAETSVEASAEAAASSASAAAASQTAAKASETNAKVSADTAAATLANTVDLSSKQTVTGAKTFAGDTTVTGSFVTSGNAEMSKLDIDTGKLTIGSGGSAEINGPLTASNTANVIKAANHDEALTSNDVLTAKDINEVNGKGNNLLHRSGDEATTGSLQARKLTVSDSNPWLVMIDKGLTRGTAPTSWRRSQVRITDDSGNLLIGRVTIESNTDKSRALDLEAYENDGNYYALLQMTCTASGTAELRFCLMDNSTSKIIKSTVIATLTK